MDQETTPPRGVATAPATPRAPMVFRIEVVANGQPRVWALVAHDFVEAAGLAARVATGPEERVVAVLPVGELL